VPKIGDKEYADYINVLKSGEDGCEFLRGKNINAVEDDCDKVSSLSFVERKRDF
jgi:hypothetical protein